LAEILDVIKHSSVSAERRRRTEGHIRALFRPMTTEEVTQELGISKPTVLKWMRAGLLSQAGASKETGFLFDRDAIENAKQILVKSKLKGTPRDRAVQLADLRERLGWAAVPEKLLAMRNSVASAKEGKGVEITSEDLALGEQLRKARLDRAKVKTKKVARANRSIR